MHILFNYGGISRARLIPVQLSVMNT